MKHKIIASSLAVFNAHFDSLIRRLEQVGEKIVKTRITWYDAVYHGYCAKVWTERESKEEK